MTQQTHSNQKDQTMRFLRNPFKPNLQARVQKQLDEAEHQLLDRLNWQEQVEGDIAILKKRIARLKRTKPEPQIK